MVQVNSDRQQQEANQEKNEQNVQNMEQQQRMSAASPMSGRRLQQSSPSPVTQQAVTNQVARPPAPLHWPQLRAAVSVMQQGQNHCCDYRD